MKYALRFLTVLCFFAASLAAQSGELGSIRFDTSGSPEAQSHFIRGVLLLHSFEYDRAKEEFTKAQQLHPDFAMAYWGEAMTYNHPVWVEQDRDTAIAALKRLGATPEVRLVKAPTQREKDYLQTMEVLYGEGSKKDRDVAYAEVMRRLHEKYPEDLEAACFYALALLGTCEFERDIPTYMRAAAIAEEVFAKNPKHPGAAHYLIHSYDDPVHAPLGLRAARVYSQIAPDATHALHMPSHIFIALGMWDEVVRTNEASWKASHEHSFHALHWLEYGYLQQGRYQDARKMLALMEDAVKKDVSQRARSYLGFMRAAYILETRRWNDDAANIRIDHSKLDLGSVVSDLLATGLCALNHGNRQEAEQALAEIEKQRKDAAGRITKEISGKPYENVTQVEMQAASIMEKELRALLMLPEQKEEALKLLQQAAEEEKNMTFDFGPPVPVKPANELLAEVLLEMNQTQEARTYFEQAQRRAPKRALSLFGEARAASKAGDTETARQRFDELRKIWEHADSGTPELAELK